MDRSFSWLSDCALKPASATFSIHLPSFCLLRRSLLMAKARIHIDDLLVWAYREQRIDRRTVVCERSPTELPAFAAGFGALQMIAELGMIIPSTGGDIADSAEEDAQRVHAAVLALGDMFIELDGEDVCVWDRADEEALGFQIRETDGGFEVRRPDGFVRPVVKAVTSVLLILCAKNGSAPDCYLGWQPGKPMRIDAKGRRVIDYDAAEITMEEVSEARAYYHVWHSALRALALLLSDQLEGFIVLGPCAPAAPWLAFATQPTVLESIPFRRDQPLKPLRRKRKLAA